MSNATQFGTRSRSRRTSSGLPRPPRRQGYPWWAYVLLAVVACGAVTLAILALSVEHETPGAQTSIVVE